jgi:hypothetical protein
LPEQDGDQNDFRAASGTDQWRQFFLTDEFRLKEMFAYQQDGSSASLDVLLDIAAPFRAGLNLAVMPHYAMLNIEFVKKQLEAIEPICVLMTVADEYTAPAPPLCHEGQYPTIRSYLRRS